MSVKDQYIIVENPNMDYNAIKLTESSPWAGFIFSFGKVQFVNDNPDGTATVKFDYNIEVLGPVNTDIANSPEFNKLLGDILIDLLEEGFASQS